MSILNEINERLKNTQIILCDINRNICQAWDERFDLENTPDYKNVSIYFTHFNTCIDNLRHEYPNSDIAIVSPANSYGLMDGGYDKAIIDYFGRDLQLKVQQDILERYCGEQPVGCSFPVNIPKYNNCVLIHTPTMRKPEIIRDHTIVYHCTRSAILCAVNQMCEVIVLPAFGGLCGQVPANIVAFYMERALAQLINPPNDITTWNYVCATHPLAQVR